MKSKWQPNGAPIVCYVTDRHAIALAPGQAAEQVLLARIRSAARAGVDWIHIREKDLDGRAAFELTRAAISASHEAKAARVAHPLRTMIFVNDRLDVAWAARADGVHLGGLSVPLHEVVRANAVYPSATLLAGASCHSQEAALQAEANGADYIFFGPVFDTPSKSAFGAPQGMARLAEVCRMVQLPVLAIGGITAENAAACLDAGAAGIAAIRAFQHSDTCADEFLGKLAKQRQA